jgi:predicted nucleotidyltransferase
MDRQEAVRRLVDYFQPERIDLFGSTARGGDRLDSETFVIIYLTKR